MSPDDLRAAIDDLHDKIANGMVDLGVPRAFYLNLLRQEDDWSFVIKLHTLMEGMVNSYLAQVIGNSAVSDLLEHIGFERRLKMVVAAGRSLRSNGFTH